MPRVLLGLGSNAGNRRENLRLALRWLEPHCRVESVSSLYRSPAVVPESAPPGPDYLNAACAVTTDLPPHELLRFVKEIEHAIGRRPAPRWSPRPIDIDILLYGDAVVADDDLVIPHPLLAERAFVIVPMAELAPEAMHPLLGKAIGELAEAVDFTGLEYLAGPEWPSRAADPPEDEADSP
jgi:2-amino-4-hydroxy-6-hydroxymethyldihydropteridine diphosphokinase